MRPLRRRDDEIDGEPLNRRGSMTQLPERSPKPNQVTPTPLVAQMFDHITSSANPAQPAG
ncbi:hypothetical protein PCASD_05414, partial [Puccinia coronata f. sp. avenae]